MSLSCFSPILNLQGCKYFSTNTLNISGMTLSNTYFCLLVEKEIILLSNIIIYKLLSITTSFAIFLIILS